MAVLCNDRGVHEIHAFGRGDDGQLGLFGFFHHIRKDRDESIATPSWPSLRVGLTLWRVQEFTLVSTSTHTSSETQGVMRQMFHSTAWFSKGDLDGLAAQLLGGITQYMLLLKVLPTNWVSTRRWSFQR